MLPEGREVTLTDTVGFIQKLPTTLVEAFKSTLDEIRGADLVLHVIDASSTEREMQMRAVEDTLQQINAQNIPRITVFNKIDLIDEAEAAALTRLHPGAVLVSAATGQGCNELIEAIARAATATEETMNVVVPFSRGDLVSLAHSKCTIIAEVFDENGTNLTVRVPRDLIRQFEPYKAS